MPKRSLRQLLLAKRKALSPAEIMGGSHAVQRKFIALEEFAAARVVALYAAVHNEVDTKEVMREALASAKVLIYPAVCGEGLVFRRISGQAELRLGAFGIMEPDTACEELVPQEADIIVVPGVAFDIGGKRIGYGKGYYDRALHRLEGEGKLVGFCFDFQLVEEIMGEPHDVKMDMIITEKRVVRPRASNI
ncbi:MAG: 5-formyltetrahydrofolate [Geobacteraceae bacterium]|nr:MAG: 5-formyltetrahydrofolate [Geobacteraceae bacterium]